MKNLTTVDVIRSHGMPPNLSVATLRGLVVFNSIFIVPRLTPLGYIISPPAEAIKDESNCPYYSALAEGDIL
jgi:hypothetical protein